MKKYENAEQLIDKPFSNVLRVIANEAGSLILVNFFFFVTSLLVITIPISMLSMQRVIYDLALGNGVKVSKTYFKYFKTYFIDSLKLLAYVVLIVGILAFSAYFYLVNRNESALYLSLSLLSLLFLAIFIGSLTALLPILSRVQLPFFQAVKNSFAIYFGKPLKALISTVIVVFTLFATFFYLPYTAPILPIFIFALLSLITTAIYIGDIENNMVAKT